MEGHWFDAHDKARAARQAARLPQCFIRGRIVRQTQLQERGRVAAVAGAAQLERIKSLPPLYQLEKLPWFMARSLRRKLRRIGSKSRISSSDNLAALAEPGPPGSDSLDGVKRKRGGLGSAEAQACLLYTSPSPRD